MKIRTGFVSNSSSSSFICCVCGREETMFDGSLRDVEMVSCVNGHCMCNDETLKPVSNSRSYEDCYELDQSYCPICQFVESDVADIAAYLLKETKIPRDEAFAEVKKLNKRRKKLYDSEYVMYACKKANIDSATILPEIKTKFGTYDKFSEYLETL
jgi:hypothetical protein